MPVRQRNGTAPPGAFPWAMAVCACLLAGQPVRAQTSEPPPIDRSRYIPVGPVLFSTSVDMSLQFTDNVQRVPDAGDRDRDGTLEDFELREPASSWLTQVRPRFGLLLPYSNSRLSIAYSPFYQDYSDVNLPERVAHNLVVENNLVLSNGMMFDLQGAFVRGVVETTDFDEAAQISFTTTPYRQRRASLAWTWDHPSRWGTVLRFDADRISFLNRRADRELETFLPFFDYDSHGVTLDGTWLARERLILYAGGAHSRTDQDLTDFKRFLIDRDLADGTVNLDPDRFDDSEEFTERSLRLGARGAFGTRIVGDVMAGYSLIESTTGSEEKFREIQVLATVEATITEASRMQLEVSRQPVETLTDQADVFVHNSVRLAWSYAPGALHAWSAAARYQVSDFTRGRVDKTFSAEAAWSMNLHRRARLKASVFRATRRSTFGVNEYAENRATVGWILGWF